MKDVWLLHREPPANEIIGVFSSKKRALAAADGYEPGLKWDPARTTTDRQRSGLWNLIKLPVDPYSYAGPGSV